MARTRPNVVWLLILLAAAMGLGASHRAQACPMGMSGSAHPSCCEGMDRAATTPRPAQSLQSRVTALAFRDCASTGHCCCSQPLSAVQAMAREVRPASLAPAALSIWPGPAVASGRALPAQGPPDTDFADPGGRHTYLATLRLRF